MNKLNVIIPYYSNTHGLAVVLTLLQSQTQPPDEIIIIDTSSDESGLAIAKRYVTNNVPVVVIHSPNTNIYKAWNKGIKISSGRDVLIINDDILMPLNFIDLLKEVRYRTESFCYVPKSPSKSHYKDHVDCPFEFYQISHWGEKLVDKLAQTDWMAGFCFMLTRECIEQVGLFDEQFNVWYGDDDYQNRIINEAEGTNINSILRIDALFVYHYGGSSYEYKSTPVQEQIDRDREYFKEKYA